MRMLLINQNPVVSKLVSLSAQKVGVEVEEYPALDSVEKGHYDLLMIDEAQVGDRDPETLKTLTGAKKVCLFFSQEENLHDGYDYKLHKPFLPTELVDLLKEIEEDMQMPEIEMEEPSQGEGAELSEGLAHEETAASGDEDFGTLLQELEVELESEESASDESEDVDLEDLLAELEQNESEPAAEVEKGEEEPELNLDDLMAQLDEDGGEEAHRSEPEGEEENLDALLSELDQGEREEVSSEVTAPAEEGGGVLDEELVSEVKDLLDEEEGENTSNRSDLSDIEESEAAEAEPAEIEEAASDAFAEEILADLESLESEAPQGEEYSESESEEEGNEATEELFELIEEESESPLSEEGGQEGTEEVSLEEPVAELPKEDEAPEEGLIGTIPEVEIPETEPEERAETAPRSEEDDRQEEIFAEFDALSEEELLEALGEERGTGKEVQAESEEEAARQSVPRCEDPSPVSTQKEQALLSTLTGMDPEALRKLLAGAQITINITFPKEVE